MVKQYPHTIEVTTVSGSTKVNGNWVAGTEETIQTTGRYEPASGNGVVLTDDGDKVNYDGIVYLPLPQQTLAPGAKVVVKSGAEVLCTGNIKRFSAGQLNARIWL